MNECAEKHVLLHASLVPRHKVPSGTTHSLPPGGSRSQGNVTGGGDSIPPSERTYCSHDDEDHPNCTISSIVIFIIVTIILLRPSEKHLLLHVSMFHRGSLGSIEKKMALDFQVPNLNTFSQKCNLFIIGICLCHLGQTIYFSQRCGRNL